MISQSLQVLMTKQIVLSADDYINIFGLTENRPVNARSLRTKYLT